ncbi:MAG: hypothetical protein Q8P24_06050 [Desulfobacterales bacterium]|nr:hypothetical protein [Desulfobacterales bacterium]
MITSFPSFCAASSVLSHSFSQFGFSTAGEEETPGEEHMNKKKNSTVKKEIVPEIFILMGYSFHLSIFIEAACFQQGYRRAPQASIRPRHRPRSDQPSFTWAKV